MILAIDLDIDVVPTSGSYRDLLPALRTVCGHLFHDKIDADVDLLR